MMDYRQYEVSVVCRTNDVEVPGHLRNVMRAGIPPKVPLMFYTSVLETDNLKWSCKT